MGNRTAPLVSRATSEMVQQAGSMLVADASSQSESVHRDRAQGAAAREFRCFQDPPRVALSLLPPLVAGAYDRGLYSRASSMWALPPMVGLLL